MKRSDFHFELPNELIARYPLEPRTASRLLCLERDQLTYRHFTDLINLLERGDLLVFNDTKVIPARLFGHKQSGGKVEVLIERIIDSHRALAHVRASKSPKPEQIVLLDNNYQLKMLQRVGDLFELELIGDESILNMLDKIGHMPLPHYMTREDEIADRLRYQTVYAAQPGAVAAPTAGLHFDEKILEQLKSKGIEFAFVTLHVGAGTFQPVRVDNILEHQMHSEYAIVTEEVCNKVRTAKKTGKRVIAVGTTAVRCLETASKSGVIKSFAGDTNIFIYPGFKFNCIDALITNFHLPESTLIMLVSAFAGYDQTMAAYQQAIKEKYRFYSYGDAMFINLQRV